MSVGEKWYDRYCTLMCNMNNEFVDNRPNASSFHPCYYTYTTFSNVISKFGYSMYFPSSGSNPSVYVNDLAGSYIMSTTAWTFSMWFNLTTLKAVNTLFSSGARNSYSGFGISLTDSNGNGTIDGIEVSSYFSSLVNVDLTIPESLIITNKWYNLVITRNGTNVYYYLNGSYLGTTTGTYAYAVAASNYYIGSQLGGSTGRIYGYIDHIRTYSVLQNYKWIKEYYAEASGKLY